MSADMEKDIQDKRSRLQRFVGRGSKESSTKGVNHIAIFALDLEATAEFYSQIIGMPVTSVTANRDEPMSTHLNVDIGKGMALSFFDFPHVPRLQAPVPEGAGGMMHVAIDIPEDQYSQVEGRLRERGVPFQRIGDSAYFKDPNGMTIELGIIKN